MQKKLIALAIAGLSSVAFAQSNVTVYGIADADFNSAKADGGTQNAAATLTGINQDRRTRVNSNSSYIGFKGSEALGNGMSAVFQIENGVNLDNSAGGAWNNRDTYVGMAGGFGTVVMGNLSTAYRSALASFELAPGATGPSAAMMNTMGKAITTVRNNANLASGAAASVDGQTVTATRVANAIAYITPNFNGIQGVLAYTAGIAGAEAKTATPLPAAGVSQNNRAWTGSLSYNNGPLKATYAYQQIKDVGAIFGTNPLTNAALGAASDTSSKVTSQLVGVGYTFGGATTVNFVWDQNKAQAGAYTGAAAAGQVDQTKVTAWALGIKHVMGAHEIVGEYVKTNNGKVSSRLNDVSGDHGAKNLALRYGYNFSKRTQAYAYFSAITNDAMGSYDYTTGAVGITGAGSDPRAFGAGLRHSF